MRNQIPTGVLLAGLTMALIVNGYAIAEKPVESSVCKAFNDLKPSKHKPVLVEADVLSDVLHGILLVDNTCAKAALRLLPGNWQHRPVALQEDDQYRAFEALRFRLSQYNQTGQVIHGRFIGLIQREKNTRTPAFILKQVIRSTVTQPVGGPPYATAPKIDTHP